MNKAPRLKYSECNCPDDPYELVFHHVERPKVLEHTHDFAEIFWIAEGRCAHLWRGLREELAPNDLRIVDPSDLHGFEMIEDASYKVVNLAFPANSLSRVLKRHALDKSFFWRPVPGSPKGLRLSGEDGAWLGGEFRALSAKPKTALSLEIFLLSLIERLQRVGADPFSSCPPWLRDACAAMSLPENFRRGPRRFEELCGRTLAHVSRALKEGTGRTPCEWVAEWRMKHAAELLSAGCRSVEEAASACGFSSMSRFYRLFSEWHGVPPAKFRRRSHGLFPSAPPSRHDRELGA